MWWESANNVHGRSNNPYDINRIVGGSSGGEGCAQAASCSAFGKFIEKKLNQDMDNLKERYSRLK